ncbi:MAG: type IV secretory system conjugative DNA transfer family protein, partial [Holophagaceae bacterium]|nr:type IV secretory system conjugative DNA transfer family protein [Holophagaceae bacterium]
SFAKNVAPERLEKDAVVLDLAKFDHQINAYEGIEESQLTPRRILEIVTKLSKSMRDDMFLSKKEPYWTNAPLDILENMLAVILYCHRKLSLDFWSELEKTIVSPDSESSLWRAEISEAEKEGRAPVSLTTRYGISYKRDNFFIPMKNFLSSALHNESWWEAFRDTCKRLKIPFSIWAFAQQIENYGMNLIGSLVSITQMWLNGLVSEELIRHVSINPIEKSKNCLDIEEMINQGKILIYSPNNNSFISDAIGRLIKGHFFAATFRRMNKTRPVAYVCDEFQRFITGDPESGEQSFLDRCRAYRGICVLATQSIASIKKALRDSGEIYPDDCISIILNNTGTKLFFRNTDVDTRDRLVKLIPENSVPLGPHILNARPIPTLKVGECYYLLSSGEWGRRQILIKKSRSTEPEQLTAHYKSQDIISTHRLQGEVTADSILKLCDEIDNAIEYLQLRHVRIEICSPGGVIKALQHYLCKLAEWRQKGVTIATTALIDASSAAAMLLSLGDVGYRTAYSTASLLYHNSRVSATSFGTAESLGKLTGDLQRIDNLMQTELVKHIYDNEKARAQINLSKLHASEIAENLQIRKSRFKNGFPTRKQYETVLKQLFDLDKPIRPEEAILLGLIDRIKDIDNSR